MSEENLEGDGKSNDEINFKNNLKLGLEILRDAEIPQEVIKEFLNELLTGPEYGHGDLDAVDKLMKSKFTPQQMIELKNVKIFNGKKI